MKSALSSASTAEDMTDLMILATVKTDPLLAGYSALLDKKKYPPALLLALDSERYEALMWPASTMLLVWYVMMASGGAKCCKHCGIYRSCVVEEGTCYFLDNPGSLSCLCACNYLGLSVLSVCIGVGVVCVPFLRVLGVWGWLCGN